MPGVRWDVDDRPPTWWTRCYVAAMRAWRDKQAFEGAEQTLATARARQRSGDHPPTRLTRAVASVQTLSVATDVVSGRVWRIRPRKGRRDAAVRVIYLHGGGYVHPLTSDYWRLIRTLVGVGAEVIVPAYPLAPDHTVDEVLPWLLEVERTTHTGLPTVVMGDSAGGALALVLGRRLADRVRRIVALCPWLDATLSQPEVDDLEPTDPMLAESGLRAAGRWWAGERSPDDPTVSPLYADLRGLPPIEVYIGDRDILRPAVDDLVARVERADGAIHVHETPAMFHVWMTRAIPEGRRTRRQLAALVMAQEAESAACC